MKNVMRSKVLVLVVLGAFLLSVTGCGYLLHEERRTAKLSNQIDGTTVLFDCLWLVAFVVPGVVALVVDGVNKTWYYSAEEWDAKVKSSQREALIVYPGQEMAIRINGAAPSDTQVTLRLQDSAGNDLAPAMTAQAHAGQVMPLMSLQMPQSPHGEHVQLVLALDGQEQVRWNINCATN